MEKKKILNFSFRGQHYQVNESGEINANGIDHFSPDWIFLGGTKHHWSNRATITLKMAFEKPKLLEGCLGFDIDHGTRRQWSGQYFGMLPRITNVYITEI